MYICVCPLIKTMRLGETARRLSSWEEKAKGKEWMDLVVGTAMGTWDCGEKESHSPYFLPSSNDVCLRSEIS